MIIIGIFLRILERKYGVTFAVSDTRKAVDQTPDSNGGLAFESANPPFFMVPKPGLEPGQAYTH